MCCKYSETKKRILGDLLKKISQGEFQKRDYEYAIIGRMLSPKRMNFREKKSKRPPPHFRKIILQFFRKALFKALYKGPKSAI